MSSTLHQNWEQLTLGDLGRVVTGRTPPSSKPELFGDQYPFITPTDMAFSDRSIRPERGISDAGAESLSRIKLPAKTPCFVCIGATIGKLCLTSEESFTNQQINSIVVNKDRHNPDFVYYLLRHVSGQVKSLAGGAATPIINKSAFSEVPVRVPSLEVQGSIASILSTYDDLIENNTRRIEILEEMARRLYEEWFVHFRFPGHEEAELESVTVGDIAEVIRGRSYRSKDLVAEGGFPFVNLKCVHRDGGFRRDGLKRYDGKYKPDQVVHHGDIVMAVTDMTQERRIVARAAMVPDLEERGGIISMDLVKVSPKANIPKEFLYAALRWSDFSENVKNHANGANVLHLHPDHIRSHVMQVPPDESRLEFSRMVKPLFDLCESLGMV